MKDLENIKDIVEKAKNGSEKDRNAILKWYYPLVKLLAYKYKVAIVNEDDAISVGWISLNKSIDKYNPNSKASFQTFASRCIVNAIYDENRRAKSYYENINTIDTNEDGNNILSDDIENILDESSDPEKITQDILLEELVMNELKKTFSNDELLIIKCYLLKQSISEIAKEVDQTENTINKTIRKYKAKIENIKRRVDK